MVKKIVLATANKHKAKEFAILFSSLDIEIIPQSEWHLESVEESGLTFVENAIIKARHAARCTGWPALADDSGLVVDVLNGEPGIYSARYGGKDADDKRNIAKLLSALESTSDDKRVAHFYCVLVFMRNELDPAPLITTGKWSGYILHQPRGEHGFGYDPVFYVADKKMSAAELSPEIKNQLSHRGLAMRAMIERLKENDSTFSQTT